MMIEDLLGPLQAQPIRVSGLDVRAVTRDSRRVSPGTAFVAIRGTKVDGHDFVGGLPPGSIAVVERPVDPPVGVDVVLVDDTHRALAWIAASLAGHPSRRLPIVGVTGTNGKTTVVTLVEQALASTGRRTGRIGTTGVWLGDRAANGTLTTPEAPDLQRWMAHMVDGGMFAAAMEVSSIGLVQRRVDAIGFHLAVFTHLGRDHLDFHGTEDAYAEAKARLFRELLRTPGGSPRALMCGDDPNWRRMDPPEDRWLYGHGAECELRILDDADALRVRTPQGDVVIRSTMVGRHNRLNLTAALGVGILLGVAAEEMADALSGTSGAPGRFERVGSGEVAVFVDYAHSPDALLVALDAAREVATGRVLLVFGCGGERDVGKRPEMGRVALSADRVWLTSDNPRGEDPQAIVDDILLGMEGAEVEVELDRRVAIRYAIRAADAGDVVLIAGKGHETTQEIGGVKLPLDDRRIAASALGTR